MPSCPAAACPRALLLHALCPAAAYPSAPLLPTLLPCCLLDTCLPAPQLTLTLLGPASMICPIHQPYVDPGAFAFRGSPDKYVSQPSQLIPHGLTAWMGGRVACGQVGGHAGRQAGRWVGRRQAGAWAGGQQAGRIRADPSAACAPLPRPSHVTLLSTPQPARHLLEQACVPGLGP